MRGSRVFSNPVTYVVLTLEIKISYIALLWHFFLKTTSDDGYNSLCDDYVIFIIYTDDMDYSFLGRAIIIIIT